MKEKNLTSFPMECFWCLEKKWQKYPWNKEWIKWKCNSCWEIEEGLFIAVDTITPEELENSHPWKVILTDEAVSDGTESYMLWATKDGEKFILKHIPWSSINNVSDGYHTFWELYKHRVHLYIALCKSILSHPWSTTRITKSKIHEDGLDVWNEWGMFLLQIQDEYEWQISYHLDKEYWDKCDFAIAQEKATIPFDGHTSDDVLDRLLKL